VTIVWAYNGATKTQLVTSAAYMLLLCGFAIAVAVAVKAGITTREGGRILAISQKIVAYGSMLYVVYFTVSIRRTLQRQDVK
jgi:hypothetical protein